MTIRALSCLTILLTAGLVGGCSSSLGGGGSSPGPTYVVLPSGQAVPAQTTTEPPGS